MGLYFKQTNKTLQYHQEERHFEKNKIQTNHNNLNMFVNNINLEVNMKAIKRME